MIISGLLVISGLKKLNLFYLISYKFTTYKLIVLEIIYNLLNKMEEITHNHTPTNNVLSNIEHEELMYISRPDFGTHVHDMSLVSRRNGDIDFRHLYYIRVELEPRSESEIEYEYQILSSYQFDMNKWQIVRMPIGNRNTECPISFETIKRNESYCTCSQCKYNFSKKSIEIALKNKLNCPTCRAKWTDKTVYINNLVIISNNSSLVIGNNKKNKKKIISSELNNKIIKTKHNKRFFYGK